MRIGEGATVSEVFGSRLMYRRSTADIMPGAERDFTVVVADSYRTDGEPPHDYAVRAGSRERAWILALTHHMLTADDVDCYVMQEQSHEGVRPREDENFHDLR